MVTLNDESLNTWIVLEKMCRKEFLIFWMIINNCRHTCKKINIQYYYFNVGFIFNKYNQLVHQKKLSTVSLIIHLGKEIKRGILSSMVYNICIKEV